MEKWGGGGGDFQGRSTACVWSIVLFRTRTHLWEVESRSFLLGVRLRACSDQWRAARAVRTGGDRREGARRGAAEGAVKRGRTADTSPLVGDASSPGDGHRRGSKCKARHHMAR
jgi:hypothetical protein